MRLLGLPRLELLVDGRPNDRVDERQRVPGPQDVRACERPGHVRRELAVHAGERRRVRDVDVVAEHRDGLRELERLGRQPGQPQAHGARCRLRPEILHPVDSAADGPYTFRREHVQKLPKRVRVAARDARAGLGERALWLGAEQRRISSWAFSVSAPGRITVVIGSVTSSPSIGPPSSARPAATPGAATRERPRAGAPGT